MPQYCIHGEENCNRCAMNEVEAPIINLHLVLDVSPSMESRWPQTISGLNEYVDSLRADQAKEGQDYRVTMTTFSEKVKTLYKEVTLDTIPKFEEDTFRPNGSGTALYDACGSTMEAINTSEPVLVVIITDGGENSSRNWDRTKLSTLMDTREKLGNYTYAYLGIAKEAWGNAMHMGAGMHRNSNNMAASAYGAETYKGLVGSTVSYSASMRSSRASGQSCNVSSFWVNPTTTVPSQDPGVVTTTFGPPAPDPSEDQNK